MANAVRVRYQAGDLPDEAGAGHAARGAPLRPPQQAVTDKQVQLLLMGVDTLLDAAKVLLPLHIEKLQLPGAHRRPCRRRGRLWPARGRLVDHRLQAMGEHPAPQRPGDLARCGAHLHRARQHPHQPGTAPMCGRACVCSTAPTRTTSRPCWPGQGRSRVHGSQLRGCCPSMTKPSRTAAGRQQRYAARHPPLTISVDTSAIDAVIGGIEAELDEAVRPSRKPAQRCCTRPCCAT